MADEEEVVEGVEEDAGGSEGAAYVPEVVSKPRSDVYTVLLLLCFLAFLAGSVIAGMELHETYDVQFWVITKK
jgi:hypothetical protein